MGATLMGPTLVPLTFIEPEPKTKTKTSKPNTPKSKSLDSDSFSSDPKTKKSKIDYDSRFSKKDIQFFTENKIAASLTNAYDKRFDAFLVRKFIEADIKPQTTNAYAKHLKGDDVLFLVENKIHSSVANSYKEHFNWIDIRDLIEKKIDAKIANEFDPKFTTDAIEELYKANIPAQVANKIQRVDLDKLINIFKGQGENERTAITKYLSSLEYPEHIPLDTLISITATGLSIKDFDEQATKLGYYTKDPKQRISHDESLFIVRGIPREIYQKFLEATKDIPTDADDFLELKKKAFDNSANEFMQNKVQAELGKDSTILSNEFGFKKFTQLTPEQFRTLVEIYKNPNHNPQKEYAVALISRDDHNGALDDNFIGTLAEKFNLLVYQVGSEEELEKALTNSEKLINSRSKLKSNNYGYTTNHLFIFGHGSSTGINFGATGKEEDDLDSGDKAILKRLASFSHTLYMPACSVGKETQFDYPLLVKTLLDYKNPENPGSIYALSDDDTVDQIIFDENDTPVVLNRQGSVLKKFSKEK